jgi:hypothetical protein
MSEIIRDEILGGYDAYVMCDSTAAASALEPIYNSNALHVTAGDTNELKFVKTVNNSMGSTCYLYDLSESRIELTYTLTVPANATGAAVPYRFCPSSGLLSLGLNGYNNQPIKDIKTLFNGVVVNGDTTKFENISLFLLNNILLNSKNEDEFHRIVSNASIGGVDMLYDNTFSSMGICSSRYRAMGDRSLVLSTDGVTRGVSYNGIFTTRLIQSIPGLADALVSIDAGAHNKVWGIPANTAARTFDFTLSLPLNIICPNFSNKKFLTSFDMSMLQVELSLNPCNTSMDLKGGIVLSKSKMVLSRYLLNYQITNEIKAKNSADEKINTFYTQSHILKPDKDAFTTRVVANTTVQVRDASIQHPSSISAWTIIKNFHGTAAVADDGCFECVPAMSVISKMGGSSVDGGAFIYDDDVTPTIMYDLYCGTLTRTEPIPRKILEPWMPLIMRSPHTPPREPFISTATTSTVQYNFVISPTFDRYYAAGHVNAISGIETVLIENITGLLWFMGNTAGRDPTKPTQVMTTSTITPEEFEDSEDLDGSILYVVRG